MLESYFEYLDLWYFPCFLFPHVWDASKKKKCGDRYLEYDWDESDLKKELKCCPSNITLYEFNLKFKAQHQDFGGKCGICGDPFEGYQPNQVPGKYATGIIGRSYFHAGQVAIIVFWDYL